MNVRDNIVYDSDVKSLGFRNRHKFLSTQQKCKVMH